MILIDTSAWIDFLRDKPGELTDVVDAAIDSDAAAICDAISMEVLAGARDECHLALLRGMLARAAVIPTEPEDYEHAAFLYRACRHRGDTVRKLADCLIAALAIKADLPLLHNDRDFITLERHTDLRVHPASRD